MSAPKAAILHPDYGPSYKPKDTDDLTKCIRRRYGHTEVWCVECEHWHSLHIAFTAQVVVTKSGLGHIAPEDRDEVRFLCRECLADVYYIVSFNGKQDEVVREYLELVG